MGGHIEKDWFWSDDACQYLAELDANLARLIRKHAIKTIISENRESINKDDIRGFIKEVLSELSELA